MNSNNNIYNENNRISLTEKISQMIMIRIDGNFHNSEDWKKKHVESLVEDYNVGGLITYTGSVHGTFYNIESLQGLSKIPMFVAADYERGLGIKIASLEEKEKLANDSKDYNKENLHEIELLFQEHKKNYPDLKVWNKI